MSCFTPLSPPLLRLDLLYLEVMCDRCSNRTLRPSIQNAVEHNTAPQTSTSNKLWVVASFHITENRRNWLELGGLGLDFPQPWYFFFNNCSLNLDFSGFVFYFFVQILSSGASGFSLSKKLILLWGGRKDFFFSCVQECRFLPPVKS